MKIRAINKTLIRMVAVITFLGFIQGCIVREPYKDPTEGTAASLRIMNNGPVVILAETYEISKDCRNRYTLGEIVPNETKTIRISTSKPITISLLHWIAPHTSYQHRECINTVEFTPTPYGKYVVRATIDKESCRVSVVSLGSNRDGGIAATPVPLKKKKWIPGFNESGPFCKPI